jgi:hypothetical protein
MTSTMPYLRLLTVAALLTGTALVAGCGSSDHGSQTTTTEQTTTQPPAAYSTSTTTTRQTQP